MNPNPPFTRAQWDALTEDERRAVDAVCAHLRGGPLPCGDDLTDGVISVALNLLRPVTEAVIPDDENDGDVTRHLQRKFRAIYHAGLTLAETNLNRQVRKPAQDFNFLLVVETDLHDTTHAVVFDRDNPRRYLHESCDATEFRFADLSAIAAKVLAVRNALVTAVLRRHTIHVVVQGGAVQEVTDAPGWVDVHVVDYDVEQTEPERLQISPLDGEACVLTKF